jgi:3-hydroxyacyl-[acyl-carrier-protein] dehydratase
MKYIPQAAPFEMIDDLVTATATTAVTQFTVRENHLFVAHGCFTEPGLIENMAQTAAAGTGFMAAQEAAPVPVGFIGAIKNFEVTRLPAIGDTIRTSTEVLHQVMNATVVQAYVHLDQKMIAQAEFKIFLEA